MVNSDKFQREFFDTLIISQGFFVEEIGDENDSLWIAMKTLENGDVYSIIISNKDNMEKNKNKAHKYLREREIKFSLSNIVLFNKDIQKESINIKDYNEILVDLHNKKIYSNDKNNIIFLKPIINSILKEKYSNKNKYYKAIGINEFTKSLVFILAAIAVVGLLVILFVERNNIYMFLNSGPRGPLSVSMAKYWIFITSGKYYEIIKDIFSHDGMINLIIFLYVVYIIIGVVDSFKNKNKYIAVYFICGFFSGLFNFFFVPYISITISMTGAVLGILGLTLLFSMKERKILGNGVLINIIIVIFVYFFIGTPYSFTYYTSHLSDITIGFLIGLILYKYNYLKGSFL